MTPMFTPDSAPPFPVWAACAVLMCALAAAWLPPGRRDGARRARLLLAGGGAVTGRRGFEPPRWWRQFSAAVRARVTERFGRAWWCLPAALSLALLGRSWIPLAAGFVAVPVVRRKLRRREALRAARRREAAAVELCTAVAGELRAGRQPDGALLALDRAVTRSFGQAGAAVLAAARFGGDVPDALRQTAALPGAEGLAGAAACWRVAVDGGAGLAEGLERVAASLRSHREQREELDAQLAGPRSTALALALLPAVGLVLGGAMEADPLHILLHTPAGLACLVTGLVLEWAGLVWVARIVGAAEGPGLAKPAGRVPEPWHRPRTPVRSGQR
ncbi:type II secretion system F family protein [Streptomyces albus]|uniref:type II secretion system F family protein n=1 Tax=Streptomyces sp. PHES57 TaxID=2872626 RepID=UPI001CECFFEB|nr:type II secretion system F family protein [Streptomyces sp. PHES57]